MRRVPGRAVWIGHAGDLRDVRGLGDAGIEAVVETADGEPPAPLPRELIRLRLPLADGGENPPHRLRAAVESVAALVRHGVPCLVCCSAGTSRSVCTTAAAIALVEGRSLSDALRILAAEGPVDVSPQLALQMQSALEEIRAERPHLGP